MNYNKKTFQMVENFASDLTVDGVYIASQKEHRVWEKDGVKKEMDVLCLFVQAPQGVFVCRSFNPAYDFADFKPGEKIVLPVAEYRVENGVKSVTFRLG